MEYLWVEDGMPNFANSVAKNVARLHTRLIGLLNSENAG